MGNISMDTISFAKTYWDERVSILLQQLARYEELEGVLVRGTKEGKSASSFSFAKRGWQNVGTKVSLTEEERGEIEEEKRVVGEAMKFDNPYVWIRYKGLAYGGHYDPNKKMDTLLDFIEHMKREKICPKRFEAVNRELKKKHGTDLTDGLVSRSLALTAVADEEKVIELSLDPDFIRLWCAHEYDVHGKWARWDKERADGGIHLTSCC